MKDKEFNKFIKPPLDALRQIIGNENTGFIICLLTDMLNEYAKDGERIIRTFELRINDFFSYKYDFEQHKLV